MAGNLRSPFDQDRMELLEKIRRLQGVEDYDTILRLGVIVPNIGTVEFEERVRRLRRDLPILYMSGYSREDVTAGGDPSRPAFLQKPFTSAELTRLVCRELEAPVRPVVGR